MTRSTPVAHDAPPHTHVPLRVRYNECDPQGVAHHASFVPWLEIARVELLRKLGRAYRDLEEAGVFFVVTELSLRYRAPARYDDELLIHVREVERSRVRIRHTYDVLRDGRILASATSTIACVNRQGRPMPIPDGALGA